MKKNLLLRNNKMMNKKSYKKLSCWVKREQANPQVVNQFLIMMEIFSKIRLKVYVVLNKFNAIKFFGKEPKSNFF